METNLIPLKNDFYFDTLNNDCIVQKSGINNYIKFRKSKIDLQNFEAWSGATETKARIIKEGKAKKFNKLIMGLYPDGLEPAELNNLLIFEVYFLYLKLKIKY